jgi:hypothetical protein
VKVLLDQGTPAPLRSALPQHEVRTAFELGWSRLTNGELLAAAEGRGFDVLITTDKNLRFQQNLGHRRMAVLVLGTTSWPRIRRHLATVASAVQAAQPGTIVDLPIPHDQ